MCGISASICFAAGGDFDAGVAEYNVRHFSQSIPLFHKALQAQPRNLSAALYLANAYYQQRQTASAVQYYRWIQSAAPTSREASTAASMLQRLGSPTGGSKASGDALTGAPAGSATSPSSAADVSSSGGMQVVLVRSLGDHPACTAEFIKTVSSAVKSFPPQVVSLAIKNKCKIYITPTMIDMHPELQNTQPGTYEQGHTFKNCPAMFEFPNVVICQYAQQGEGADNWQPCTDPIGALRHEFGHAIDAFLGYVTRSEEFKHAYEMERTAVRDPEARGALQYYVQDGGRDHSLGSSETFAEGSAIVFGGGQADWSKKEQSYFKQAFPNVLRIIKTKLDEI